MKKEKEEKEKKETNEYRKQIYALMAKEKKENTKEKLQKKGVMVGEGYNVKKLKAEYRKEKIKESVGKFAEKALKSQFSSFKKPILRTPHTKLPSVSTKKFLRSFTNEHQALVRQTPEREQFEEPRSLFFREEFIKEKRKGGFL